MNNFIVAAGYLALVHAQNPPVFTLGPASNYVKAPATTAIPRNHEISILPEKVGNSIPDGGIDVFFGSDLQNAISSTLDSDACKGDGISSDCAAALGNAFDAQHALTVEKRVVGIDDVVLLGGAALVGIISFAIELNKKEKPKHIHLEASDLSAIRSQTATNIAVATASNANPITVFVTPTPSPSAGTVSTLTADDGEHKSGDAAITLPTGIADIIDQLIMKSDDNKECLSETAQKRGILSSRSTKPSTPGLMESVRRLVEFALAYAGEQGLLGDMGLQKGAVLPTITDPGAVAVMEQSREYAAQLTSLGNIAQDVRNGLSDELFFTIWAYCSYNIGAGGISPVYVPPSHNSQNDDYEAKNSSSAQVVPHYGGDQKTLQWYSIVINEMLTSTGDEDTSKDPGKAPYMLDDTPSDMTGDDFKAVARDQLCHNVMQRIENGQPGLYSMTPYGVDVTITRDAVDPNGSCKLSDAQACERALDDMANKDSGRRGDGGKWMAAKITKDTGCGNFTLSFPDCSHCKDEPQPQEPQDTAPLANSQCDNGDGLATSIQVSGLINRIRMLPGTASQDSSTDKNGNDECTVLGLEAEIPDAGYTSVTMKLCGPAGMSMQYSRIAEEADQFVKDCEYFKDKACSFQDCKLGGRKYVNADGLYILVTQ